MVLHFQEAIKFIFSKTNGVFTIHHWMGTDVLNALKNKKLFLKVKLTSLFVDLHFACSPELVSELSTIGIKAYFVQLFQRLKYHQ